MRRTAPRPLGVAVGHLAGELQPATALARVQGVWDEAVGPTIAAESRPVSERAGVVTVACGSAVWAQELELLSADLKDRLERAVAEGGGGPRIASLRFVVRSG
jgi:predicted nucleic acid-binding Zn ribbon protein